MPVLLDKKIKSILDSQSETMLKNRLIDDEIIVNDTDGKYLATFDLSFKTTQLTTESKIILRHAIIVAIGGYQVGNEIKSKNRTVVKQMVLFLNKLNPYLVKNSIRYFLNEFKFDQYYDFLYYVLSTPTCNDNSLVYSLATLHNCFNSVLHSFSKLAAIGEISWGTTQTIPKSELQVIGCKYIKEHHPELDLLDWQYGGSLETVSLSTAALMLNYCLEQLESLEHKMLTSYFDVCRESDDKNWYLKKGVSLTTFHHLIVRYKTFDLDLMGNIRLNIKSHFSKITLPNTRLWYEKTKEKYDDDLSIEQFIDLISDFSKGKIVELSGKFHKCSLAVISILTGIRVHELVNMKANNAIDNKNGLIYLVTRIDKTHQGLPVKRTTGDAVSMAVDSLLDISYIDKTQKVTFTKKGQKIEGYYSLFVNATVMSCAQLQDHSKAIKRLHAAWLEPATSSSKSHGSRNTKLNNWMRWVFDQTLEALNPELRKEVLELNERITIHAFRHCFVDFLLRRFDGDVVRAIRRCFAHSSKDPFNYVQNYIRNKVTPQAQKTAERAYTQELIKKIAGDVNHSEFSGASVEYVRKKLGKIQWATVDELDEFIYNWVSSDDEGLIRIIPHSYGFCILFKGREHLAKCLDNVSGVPKTERGESKMCPGCSNFVVKADSHLSTLTQLQMVHQNILAESKNPKNLIALLGSSKNRSYHESSRIIKSIDVLTRQFKEMEA